MLDVDIADELLKALHNKIIAEPGMIIVASSCDKCIDGDAVILEIYKKSAKPLHS